MLTMKEDMAGAAAVLAVMSAVPQTVKAIRVLGLMAAVENMPGPAAMKPGDIFKAMNGKTIEITNTDAEGRLALADALAYAAAQRVNEIIDLATLTGGARVALGLHAAALMGTDQRLMDALRSAGEEAGERLWPLPLYEEFSEAMKSRVADLRNSASRWGSAEKGGAFLKEFTGGKPWAHLDIAPVAFIERDEGSGPYRPVGSATGFGVRTLLTYLRRLDGRR
jgi:leucyl aminopeptidase